MALLGNKPQASPMAGKAYTTPAQTPQINMIGEGAVVEGTVHAGSDIRVRGKVVGKLNVDGKAIVAQEGEINGEIVASSADIAGLVQGQVNVSGTLVLKSTAQVSADIRTARLVVEEGAVFDGKCKMGDGKTMNKEEIKSASVTQLKPKAANA